MTGPITEQPFSDDSEDVICIFNGEIYNFEEFGNYKSDGECLIPLYKKYNDSFISRLDGEFALILCDFKNDKLIISTDIFGTRPLWMGFNEDIFGISTYKSCLDRIDITSNFQILANKTYFINLKMNKIIREQRVHTFNLTQSKTTFDDWNVAFSNSIKKRTKYAKCGIFIGMSGGYDSGSIACELKKQNIKFSAYSIINTEDEEIMKKRKNIIQNTDLINITRPQFLNARSFLKNNAEEYLLNIDNGERDKYNCLIKKQYYNKETAQNLLNIIDFRKNGQILTDDNGAIGCSYIASLAKLKNEKIYLSGSGADEIFSDYGFNGIKYFDHSTIGGYYPTNLEKVFPWKNFFRNTQRAYLMKEEHVCGAYGIEGRYPFLDKYVVQEFLWLTNDLKNKNYKSPLDNYLTIHNFPFEKNQKVGFGCGHSGPTKDNKGYHRLSKESINNNRTRKVIDVIDINKVDFTKNLKYSYEYFDILNKDKIIHCSNNMYKYNIKIIYTVIKNYNKKSFILLEDNIQIGKHESNHSTIATEGNGLYCFWTSNILYFSSSDNSSPITNNKLYYINKL